jgi:hypothetical protein
LRHFVLQASLKRCGSATHSYLRYCRNISLTQCLSTLRRYKGTDRYRQQSARVAIKSALDLLLRFCPPTSALAIVPLARILRYLRRSEGLSVHSHPRPILICTLLAANRP